MRKARWGRLVTIFFLLACGILVSVDQASFAPKADSVVYDRLRIWALENGAELDKVKWPVFFPETGRGMAAAVHLRGDDETIMTIPLRICIRRSTGLSTPFAPVLKRLDEFAGTVAMLLYERLKGNASFFTPFLDYLPTRYDMVEEWSEEEVKEFQDEEMINGVKTRREQVNSELNKLRVIIRKYGTDEIKRMFDTDLNYTLYHWAWTTVGTRSFGFVAGEPKMRPTLVPIADLMNNHPDYAGRWDDEPEPDGRVIIKTSGNKGFKPGQEIFIHYGSYSNFATVFNYGFIIPNNSHHFSKLMFPASTPHRGRKIALNGNEEYGKLHWKVNAVSTARLFRLIVRRPAGLLDEVRLGATSRGEERRAMRFCVTHLRTKLAIRQTSLQDDIRLASQLAASHDISGTDADDEMKKITQRRLALALQYRIDEKKVLKRHISFCSRVDFRILQCVTARFIRSPRYFRALVLAAESIPETK